MMVPEASPSPSEVPVNKDDNGGNDSPLDLGLQEDSNTMTNTLGNDFEESSDENENEYAEENLYSGYVALEQQPLDEGSIADGEMGWVEQHQLTSNYEDQADDCTDEDVHDCSDIGDEADSSNLSSQVHEKPLPTNSIPIPITDAHAEVIKQAMSGFLLPSSNIPEWARVVPEENWKSKLMDSIAKKH